MVKVLVLTVSDRAARGEYADKSGPAIENVLRTRLENPEIQYEMVPDEPEKIENAFKSHAEMDFIFTTGGTGIGPRDITPEVTAAFCDKAYCG